MWRIANPASGWSRIALMRLTKRGQMRGAQCVWFFLVRSLFAFITQLTHLVIPETDLVSPGALGTVTDERGDGSDGQV